MATDSSSSIQFLRVEGGGGDKEDEQKEIDFVPLDVDESIIFVSVPSYRDPECPLTLLDLFTKAKNPNRIVVGVCEQNELGDVQAVPSRLSGMVGTGSSQRIMVTSMPARDAKGPVYARAVIENELIASGAGSDVEVFMQIDSHTRVVKHWDAEIVESLKECELQKGGDGKVILSTFPSDYETGTQSKNPLARTTSQIDSFGVNFRDLPNFNAFHSWHRETGMAVTYDYKAVRHPDIYHHAGAFAANFAVGRYEAWCDVPNDMNLPYLFVGEEQTMGARMYTHGWDIMLPKRMMLYSKSDRKYRHLFWENLYARYKKTAPAVCAERDRIYAKSLARAQSLMMTGTLGDSSLDDDMFGLGSARTLTQYEAHMGLDYKNKVATVRARLGIFDASSLAEWMDKHGQPPENWKRVYENSLERNFMPLEGLAPDNIRTVSHAEFILSTKKASSSSFSQPQNRGRVNNSSTSFSSSSASSTKKSMSSSTASHPQNVFANKNTVRKQIEAAQRARNNMRR